MQTTTTRAQKCDQRALMAQREAKRWRSAVKGCLRDWKRDNGIRDHGILQWSSDAVTGRRPVVAATAVGQVVRILRAAAERCLKRAARWEAAGWAYRFGVMRRDRKSRIISKNRSSLY